MSRFGCSSLAILLLSGQIAIAADWFPDDKTGLKVGEKAPAFKLMDQNGSERTLKELHKDNAVALVFYRSASW